MTHTPQTIGLDVGGTSLKCVALTRAGKVLARETMLLDPSDPRWIDRVAEQVRRVEATFGAAESVGLAAPGIAAPDGTSIWWMQGRRAELQGLDWATFLRRPRVPVLNDAQAALLGEAWQGAAAGCSNVVMLTLGTGVGGAAMVDGRLLKGHLGRAGHLGHISLDPTGSPDIVNTPGSLEEAIGNCTIERRTNGRYTSTLALAAAASGGDQSAAEIWQRAVRALAAGIASLINVLDPQVFVIGGGVASAGPVLFDPLRQLLDTMEWRPHGATVRIVPAHLGEYAGAIGAAKNAMQEPTSPTTEGPPQ